MSTSTPNLPLIDISPFLIPNPTPDSIKACTSSLSLACLNHGFFYLINHKVPTDLTDHVLSLAREFFTNCTPKEKALIAREDAGKSYGDGARGYQVVGDNVTQGKRDWHEAIDWYRPIVEGEALTASSLQTPSTTHGPEQESPKPNGTPNGSAKTTPPQRSPPYPLLHGINLWPTHPTAFKAVYEIYIQHMLTLGTAVVRAMGHALDLSDGETFVAATRESFWVMRAIGYPPLPPSTTTTNNNHHSHNADDDDDGSISCGAHTDYGCLTLLLADATPGALQVQSRADAEVWLHADPVQGAFVVNIGDMMERWTGGLWRSTRHRVVHRGPGMRVSVPFFFEPDFEAQVGVLEELRGREGVGEGRRVRYGDHLVGKVGGNFYGGGEG